jgi:hypothetical protein
MPPCEQPQAASYQTQDSNSKLPQFLAHTTRLSRSGSAQFDPHLAKVIQMFTDSS